MVDTISGPVIFIENGNTFYMEVTQQGKENKHKYNNAERVFIADLDTQEQSSLFEKRSRNKLKNILDGKEVLCTIKTRDSYSRIVADVKVL